MIFHVVGQKTNETVSEYATKTNKTTPEISAYFAIKTFFAMHFDDRLKENCTQLTTLKSSRWYFSDDVKFEMLIDNVKLFEILIIVQKSKFFMYFDEKFVRCKKRVVETLPRLILCWIYAVSEREEKKRVRIESILFLKRWFFHGFARMHFKCFLHIETA